MAGALVLIAASVPVGGGEGLPDKVRALYARPAAEWPPAQVAPGIAYVELSTPDAPLPAVDAAQVSLGRALFFDPILSRRADMSCATCHDSEKGWSNGQMLGPGADPFQSARNVPGLLDVASRVHLGWDGAETSLAEQSLRPLTRGDEMDNPDLAAIIARLGARDEYRTLFAEAYGDPAVDAGRVGRALAAFQTTLAAPTRVDAFLRGDQTALTDREVFGLHLFRTKAGCANCHFGPWLSDGGFHNLGLSAFGEPREDLGRHRVTGHAGDIGRFRTPSLRHVARTAPYMHNGLFPTLEGVVNFYARGGGQVWVRNAKEAADPLHEAAARLDPLLHPLDLDAEERAALVEFLQAL